MDNKKNIADRVDMNKLACKLGYYYICVEMPQWVDDEKHIHYFSSMSNRDMKKCIRIVKRDIRKMRRNKINSVVKENVSLMLDVPIENITNKDVKIIKKRLIKLLKEKKDMIAFYRSINLFTIGF